MTFLVICFLGLAGYASAPFAAAETVATAVWLNVLHLVVAAPVVAVWARHLPSTRG